MIDQGEQPETHTVSKSDPIDAFSGRTRRSLLAGLGTSAVVGLAGCMDTNGGNGNGGGDGDGDGGGGGDDGGETTIEYWRWPHSYKPANEFERDVIERFNEKDNGITVEELTVPTGDFITKLKSAIASDNAPDVAWNRGIEQLYDPIGKSREDIENNAPYAYLENHIEQEFFDEFWDAIWVDQLNRFKGRVGIPFYASFGFGHVYVNVDAWEQAGLGDLPTDSWTFEEWHAALEAMDGLTVNGQEIQGWALGLQDINSFIWNIPERVSRTSGKVIGSGYQNADDEWVLTMADDAMRRGWENIYQIPIDNGWTTDPLSRAVGADVQPFYSGSAGILLGETWARQHIAQNAEFEWALLPIPTNQGKTDYWLRDGSALSMQIYREEVGGNPQAAAEFATFRNNAENHYKWMNITSQGPANRGAYDLYKSKGLSEFAEKAKTAVNMETLKSAFEGMAALPKMRKDRWPDIKTQEIEGQLVVEQGIPGGAGGGQIHEIAGGQMQRMIKGKDPQQALEDMESEWTSVLEGEGHAVKDSSVGYNKPTPKSP